LDFRPVVNMCFEAIVYAGGYILPTRNGGICILWFKGNNGHIRTHGNDVNTEQNATLGQMVCASLL
jgi:hypothetical protein